MQHTLWGWSLVHTRNQRTWWERDQPLVLLWLWLNLKITNGTSRLVQVAFMLWSLSLWSTFLFYGWWSPQPNQRLSHPLIPGSMSFDHGRHTCGLILFWHEARGAPAVFLPALSTSRRRRWLSTCGASHTGNPNMFKHQKMDEKK